MWTSSKEQCPLPLILFSNIWSQKAPAPGTGTRRGGFCLLTERIVQFFYHIEISRIAGSSCSPLNHYLITSTIREKVAKCFPHRGKVGRPGHYYESAILQIASQGCEDPVRYRIAVGFVYL